jgi:hypothetical protein
MLKELKSKLQLEVRPNSREGEYLEAVVKTNDLEALNAILVKHLGHPVKKGGKHAELTGEAGKVAGMIGGIRTEQTFYCSDKDDAVYYAALWPWASDPLRITLKAGILKK